MDFLRACTHKSRLVPATRSMSALAHFADSSQTSPEVREVPEAVSSAARKSPRRNLRVPVGSILSGEVRDPAWGEAKRQPKDCCPRVVALMADNEGYVEEAAPSRGGSCLGGLRSLRGPTVCSRICMGIIGIGVCIPSNRHLAQNRSRSSSP